MNIVESVTTIGCRRSNAMKKPLKAPVAMPMPMPASVHTATDVCVEAGSMLGQDHVDERDDCAGRQVEAAGEDHQGLADGGDGEVAAPLAMKLMSK